MTILRGDCREQLATLPDASVDSIVTDPPYELGFMGKRWDASGIAYDPIVWAECLRVLKPGGHLCAFGGTRTYHRMVVAIEDAGFEIRDSLHWIYGSGFPKSLDVSKAIDKAAGAERQVVGTRKLTGTAKIVGGIGGAVNGTGSERYDGATIRESLNLTVPATDAAHTWSGWGTALKPAHEPIVVARKPLAGTVAANVLEYGTGALNIDGCRVGTEGGCANAEPQAATRKEPGALTAYAGSSPRVEGLCRWPANLVLTHSADCEQIGTTPDTFGGGAKATSGFVDGYEHDGFVGQIVETTIWECSPGCPVATLNAQSGDRPGGTFPTQRGNGVATGSGPGKPTEGGKRSMGDTGGASRFFTVTTWDPELDVPFLYVAKPSRRERNAGLDDANHHPTVKPTALMRHLVRLVTPPGGTVLDPFLGSGTTAVAAILEGFEWVGCELTDDYVPLIEARVEWAQHQTTTSNPTKPQLTLDIQ